MRSKAMKIKKVMMAALVCLCAIQGQGQTVFDATEIDNAIKTVNTLKKHTTKWAKDIARLGRLDKDSNICWIFNVPVKDSLYYSSIDKSIREFIGEHNPNLQLDFTDSSLGVYVIKTVFPKILYSDGTLSLAMSIDGHGEMVVHVTPNNIILTMKVQRYVNPRPYSGASSSSRNELFMRINSVAPFKSRGDNKQWSKAFVDCNAECLNLAHDFIDYINSNYKIP